MFGVSFSRLKVLNVIFFACFYTAEAEQKQNSLFCGRVTLARL